MKEHQAIHKFSDSRERGSARVFPARENERSDDVLDAATLNRPRATLAIFIITTNEANNMVCLNTVCTPKIKITAKNCQIRRPFPRSFRRNNVRPAGIARLSGPSPRYSRNIHSSYPYPRETRGFRGIPAIPIPMHNLQHITRS